MVDHALDYAERNWAVFPLRTDGDIKAPHQLTTEGREKGEGGHHVGSTDAAVVRSMWKRAPNAGIGLNFAKSGMVLVDVDPRKDGDKSLARLRREYPGVFESTIEGATGGDGLHLFFNAEPGMRYPGNLGPGYTGIDIKHNGYGILYPSPHPSGKRYAWSPGKTPDDGELGLPTLSATLMHEIREAGRRGSGKAARAAAARTGGSDTITEVAEDDDPFAHIHNDRQLGLTEEQIRKIVFDIPNDGHEITNDPDEYVKSGARIYDDWFKVLCGIFHETDGSEEGRQIALDWCEQAAVHTMEKFDKSWASADAKSKGFAPVTFRSVIEMSNAATKDEREKSFEAIRARFVEAEDLDTITEAVQAARVLALANPLHRDVLLAEYRTAYKRITNATLPLAKATRQVAYIDPTITNVPEWCRHVCFISGENRFVDTRDARREWTKESFDNTFMREAMTEEDIRSGASRPTHSPSDLALTRYKARMVDARGYLPWDKNWRTDPFYEMDGRSFLNTYSGRLAVKMPKVLGWEELDAIEVFKRLVLTIFPHDEWMVCSWLRYVISTKKRVGWSPLFYSPEGIGKTLLFELIGLMVGRNNVIAVNGSALSEKFNAWAEGRLIAFVEEVGGYDRKDRFDALNAIKPVITNDHISVRRMRMDNYEVLNTVNVMMTTNKSDAFDLSRGDTRIWIPTPGFRNEDEVESFKRANPRFYAEVADAFSHHPGAIKRYLLERPYHPDFHPGSRAPASAMKREIIEENKSDEQVLIEDALKVGRVDVSNELLRIDALVEVCGDLDAGMALPQDRWLARLLQGMGFKRLGRAQPGGSKAPKGMFWSRKPDMFQGAALAARINAWIEENDAL